MKIIVGLGNPGLHYRRSRHNLGFMVVSEIARRRGIRFRRGRYHSTWAEGRLGKYRLLLVRPQTFMNRSGLCVAQVMRQFDRPLEDLLVVCDDVNLELGQLRIRRAGSAGGHNGLTSVIEALHSRDLARLRLGVGSPPDGADMVRYVLGQFRRQEWDTVHSMVEEAAQAAETWAYHGADEAMNQFNRSSQPGSVDNREELTS